MTAGLGQPQRPGPRGAGAEWAQCVSVEGPGPGAALRGVSSERLQQRGQVHAPRPPPLHVRRPRACSVPAKWAWGFPAPESKPRDQSFRRTEAGAAWGAAGWAPPASPVGGQLPVRLPADGREGPWLPRGGPGQPGPSRASSGSGFPRGAQRSSSSGADGAPGVSWPCAAGPYWALRGRPGPCRPPPAPCHAPQSRQRAENGVGPPARQGSLRRRPQHGCDPLSLLCWPPGPCLRDLSHGARRASLSAHAGGPGGSRGRRVLPSSRARGAGHLHGRPRPGSPLGL